MKTISVAGLCLLVGAHFAAASVLNPVGAEFQVNVVSAPSSLGTTAAVDQSGYFIVVWDNTQDVLASFYNPDRTLQASELPLNSSFTANQRAAHVAADPAGGFIVVWEGLANVDELRMRRFATDGAPLGVETQVNVNTTGNQSDPDISILPNGDFIVVWTSTALGSQDIAAQRFSSSGQQLGGEFIVNSVTTSGQDYPACASGPDGRFIVTWSVHNDGVFAQRFLSDGTKIGGDFQISSGLTGNVYGAPVAVGPDGSFVVVWADYLWRIWARRIAADGSPITNQFTVAEYNGARFPTIAASRNGEFVISWSSDSGPTDLVGAVLARHYSSTGVAQGAVFEVNSMTTGLQIRSAIAAGARGDFVATWSDGDDFKAQKLELTTQLANGIPQEGILAGPTQTDSWSYYYADLAAGSADLLLDLYNLTGDLELYVQLDRRPTESDNICSSVLGGSSAEHCAISSPAAGRWWIGVTNYATGTAVTYLVNTTWTESTEIFSDGFETGGTSEWSQVMP